MSDQKTERLINLTLALLASKRYLSKSEIFNSVAGYSGSAESMERMFERDKDELRNLGIQIEVKALDPLFDDDQGYLIASDTFQLNTDDFTNDDLVLLNMAANLWSSSALGEESRTALLKIHSISGPINNDQIFAGSILDNQDAQILADIFEAVDKQIKLQFKYKGIVRRVKPYGLFTQNGFWYLVAEENEAIKQFKLIRIQGDFTLIGSNNSFPKPEGFDLKAFFQKSSEADHVRAQILVRKNQALSLRNQFSATENDEEWDSMKVHFDSREEMIERLLWHLDSIKVESPIDLRDEVLNRLKELANG